MNLAEQRPLELGPQPPDKKREVYRWRDGKERAHRPIDYYLQEVLDKLKTDQVVVVQAETGVGKTTRIPQAILDHDPQARVYMTQTKRPPVRMNARAIAKEMAGLPINADISDEKLYAHEGARKIGWRLRGENPTNFAETRAVVQIDQSLTNKIRHEKRLPEGYLIIDEAHERTVQIDILLALIKEYLPRSPKTKVLITSATIDTEKFKNFFQTSEPVIAKNEQLYPVEVKPWEMADNEHHTQGAIRALTEEVMTKWVNKQLTIPGKHDSADRITVTSGSVLVLLPGKEDIKAAMAAAQAMAKFLEVSDRVQILACHSQVEKDEQELIAKPVPAGTLRIVCATEIIRSSVTVPQVVGVIDSLQVKRYSVDKDGVSHLGKVTISGAEADQGKGRAGREQPGFYIPVTFRSQYNRIINRQDPAYWPQPAIQREAPTSSILQIASVGLSIRTLNMLDKPSQEAIDVAVWRLQRLGALDESEKITPKGELLLKFPIEPERAMVLFTAEKLNVLPEAMIATAVLEHEGLQFIPSYAETTAVVNESTLKHMLHFYYPQAYQLLSLDPVEREARDAELLAALPPWVTRLSDGKYNIDVNGGDYKWEREGIRKVADIIWLEFAGDSQSDFFASVQAFRAFKAEQRRLYEASDEELGFPPDTSASNKARDRRIEKLEREWCVAHFLNYQKLKLIAATLRDLKEEVDDSPFKMNGRLYEHREFSSEDLTKALMSGLIDNVVSKQNSKTYAGPIAKEITKAYSSALKGDTDFILVGGVHKAAIVTRHDNHITKHFADLTAPLNPDWFMEVMPQLCSQTLIEDKAAYDPETGQVLVVQKTFYGLVEVKEEKIPFQTEAGTKLLALAILEGKTGHQHEATNRQQIIRLSELLKRDQSSINIEQKILDWYVSRLGTATAISQIKDLDLQLTDQVLTELLGTDFQAYETKVLLDKPNEFIWEGVSYPITYYGRIQSVLKSTAGRFSNSAVLLPPTFNSSEFYAKLALPISVIEKIDWLALPGLEGFDIELSVSDEKYHDNANLKVRRSEENSLPKLRDKIEEQRKKLVWDEYAKKKGMIVISFRNSVHREPIVVPYQQPFPALPAPEVWDEVTQALAYPAYKKTFTNSNATRSNWVVDWYPTATAASEAQAEAEALLKKEDDAEYVNINYASITAELKAQYNEIAALYEGIDPKDKELYGLTDSDMSTFSGLPNSLPNLIYKAQQLVGFTQRASPKEAQEVLHSLKTRLEAAQQFYATKGQEMLAFRQEKESLTAPEKPPGFIPLFVYRTPSGVLVASPAADLTGSGRSSRTYILEGNGVRRLSDEVNEQLDSLIRPSREVGALTSRKWYLIPESGTFTRKTTLTSGKDGGEQQFHLSSVPAEVGLYGVFTDHDFDNPQRIAASKIRPVSYKVDNQPRVALSLFDVTNWLVEKESQYPGKLFVGRVAQVSEEKKKEVWYEARNLYERVKNANVRWLALQDLDPTAPPEGNGTSAAEDPVEAILSQEVRTTSISQAMRRVLVAEPQPEELAPKEIEVEPGYNRTAQDLKAIAQKIEKWLSYGTAGNLRRAKVKYHLTALENNPSLSELFAIEQDLKNTVAQENISFSQVEQEALAPNPIVKEVAPAVAEKLRIDEYAEIVALTLDELKKVINEEKGKDVGKWRLAVAAVASKGYEATRWLAGLKLETTVVDAVEGALTKALSKASSVNRGTSEQAQQVEQALLALSHYRWLVKGQAHPLVDAYLGAEDTESREKFASQLYDQLTTTNKGPEQSLTDDQLDSLVLEVIEAL